MSSPQQGDPMHEQQQPRTGMHPFSKKLILVLEQDEQIGTRFVQLIRQETPYQALLARNLSEVRSILTHLKCDLMLRTDEIFPDEDLERLYLLPADIEPPGLLDATFLSWAYHSRDGRDVRTIVKAIVLLLAVREGNGPVSGPFLLGCWG